MGVSGGGGDPLLALVVEVEAVEAKRLTLVSLGNASWFEAEPGGG